MRNYNRTFALLWSAIVVIILAILAPASANAADFFWTGAGATDNWSNPFNWESVSAPINDLDSTYVLFYPVALRTQADLNADWVIHQLGFADDIAGTDQSFTLNSSNGSTLTIGSGGIYNTSEVNQTINHAITLGDSQTWYADSGDLTINGARSGVYTLTIVAGSASRVIFLGGSGSGHNGNINISSGILRIGNSDAISASTRISVSAGATFDLNHTGEDIGLLSGSGTVNIGSGTLEVLSSSQASTFSGALIGSSNGTFTKSGLLNLVLSGNNSNFFGAVVVSAGSLQVGVDDSLSHLSPVSVASGATLRIGGDGEGFGSLAGVAGSSVLLQSQNIGVGSNNTDSTFAGVISGNGGFTKSGNGTMTLSGANTFTGVVDVAAGTLVLGLGDNLTDQHAVSIQSNATLSVDSDPENFGSLSGAGTLGIKQAVGVGFDNSSTTFSGQIIGTGNLAKYGSGTMILSGVNTFGGTVTVAAGTLELGLGDNLTNIHAVTVESGATLGITGDAESLGSLAGAGSIDLAQNIAVGFNHTNTTYSGSMTGVGNFTKSGNGTMSLTGSISLSGAVTVAGGLLTLEGGKLRTAGINFSGGGGFNWTSGTLHVGLFGDNLVNLGGILAPGSSAGLTTIVGNYTQMAGGSLEIEIGGLTPVTTFDMVEITGSALLDGNLQLKLIDGLVPSADDSFVILEAASGIFGMFVNVANGQRLTTSDGTGSFLIHYGVGSAFDPTQIVLTDFLPASPGDCNMDSDVDLDDHAFFTDCLEGPAVSIGITQCECFDLNVDGAVDLLDFSSLQPGFGLP